MDRNEYKKSLDAAVRHAHERNNRISEESYSSFFSGLQMDEREDALTREYFKGLGISFGEESGGEALSTGSPGDGEEALRGKKLELTRRCMSGDREAREGLISLYINDVEAIARLYVYHGLPEEDLIGEGNIGLIKAVDRLPELKDEAEAEGFIGSMIMDAMDSLIESEHRYREEINGLLERIEGMQKAAVELSEELRRDVSPAELSLETDYEIEEIREALYLTGNHIRGLSGREQ